MRRFQITILNRLLPLKMHFYWHCTIILMFFQISNLYSHYSHGTRNVWRQKLTKCAHTGQRKEFCIGLRKCAKLGQVQADASENTMHFLQKVVCGHSGSTVVKLLNECCSSSSSPRPTPEITTVINAIQINQIIKPTVPTTKPQEVATSKDSTQPPMLTSEDYPTQTTQKPMKNSNGNSSMTPFTERDFESLQYHRNIRLLPQFQECGYAPYTSRIIGGGETGMGTYPWMVLIGYKDSRDGKIYYACGGTIINKRYILTAAHCVAEATLRGLDFEYKPIHVKLGVYDTTKEHYCENGLCMPPPQIIEIEEILTHEKYAPKSQENDISMLRLAKVPFTGVGAFVVPICLPSNYQALKAMMPETDNLVVAGWGRTLWDKDAMSPRLKDAVAPLAPMDECIEFYKRVKKMQIKGQGRFCAGGLPNQDSCKGDSGGPLMLAVQLPGLKDKRTVQFGIISAGVTDRCGEGGQYSLYTRVTDYMIWILDHLQS